jgi:hypothetical protein
MKMGTVIDPTASIDKVFGVLQGDFCQGGKYFRRNI